MTHPDNLELICEHDPSDPSHLVCRKEISKNKGNGFWEFFYKRYHRHYHARRRHGRKHLVADIVILCAVTLLLAADITLRIIIPTIFPRTVDVVFSVPDEGIRSGRSVSLLITIANNLSETMSDVSLAIQPPPNFTVEKFHGQSLQTDGTTLKIDTLRPRQVFETGISGTPFGALSEEQEFKAVLSYRTDASPDIQKIFIRKPYSITGSAVRMTIEGPSSAFASEQVTYTVSLIGPSGLTQLPGTLAITPPKDFTIGKTSHKREGNRIPLSTWNGSNVEITGHFPLSSKDERSFDFKFHLSNKSSPFIQAKEGRTIAVQQTPLAVSLKHTDGDALSIGKKRELTLEWENTSSKTLANAQIGVRIMGDGIDGKTLSSGGAVKTSDTTLTWSKTQNSNLKTLAPGARGRVTFFVTPAQLKNLSSYDTDHDFAMQFAPQATYTVADTHRINTFGTVRSLPLSSQLTVSANAHYFSPEGEQLGRGPLPPIVGKTTKYIGVVTLQNTIHPVEKTIVTVTVPKNVRITRFMQGSWDAGTLPPALGKNPTDHQIIFELSVTPESADRGKIVPLLTGISITGVDAVTQSKLTASAPDITTQLKDSREAHFAFVQ